MKKMTFEFGRKGFEILRLDAQLPPAEPVSFPVPIQNGKRPVRKVAMADDDIRRCRTSDRQRGCYHF